MLNLGIVGFGHVVINQHFPILSANKDINISWVLEPKYNDIQLLKKLKIPVIESIDLFDQYPETDIVLITSPYGTRAPVFEVLKGKVRGIYCEKPFAKSIDEHLSITEHYQDYAFAIGYGRRSLGHVNIIKNAINDQIFGELQAVECEYGYYRISSGSFHSNFDLAGGGILFESGVHWIDTMLYTIDPLDLNIINANVEYNAKLDIHTEAYFSIKLNDNKDIDCNITITHLKKTANKISYIFKDVIVELYLYDENQPPVIIPKKGKGKKYEISNFLRGVIPSSSLGQGVKFWEDYLSSFLNQKISYTNANQSLLTTKVIEQIYTF